MPEFLTWKDRRKVESFRRIGEDLILGQVTIELDQCTGCGSCVNACPAASLEVKDKKAKMTEVFPMCFSCGNCTAICPEDAITITRFIEFKRIYRYLDRGEPHTPRKF
jgi:ferredoxin